MVRVARAQQTWHKCTGVVIDCTVFHIISSLVVGLTLKGCALYPPGIHARRRAQFAAAIRVASDLDDESLRLVLKFIPAWVKHSEYERAKCVTPARPRAPLLPTPKPCSVAASVATFAFGVCENGNRPAVRVLFG